ncbi:MAG: hypothetical protein AUH91_01530 [Verrucomicrobia bacterium 13_1_40CM_4_54_4]|nr:MAG: hypothetical protein AUH91_01530 [Verrucomicrobia bacterium 13_1_40CM_4_54_4]
MLRRNSKQRRGKSKFTGGFCISNGPIISQDNERERDVGEFDDVGLPRVHGASMLFAIARDPRTIFTCWSIDWPTIFAKTVPVDRQVHLRVYRADAVEEKSLAVEPMAGYCYISVSRPSGSYHVGIGYYQPADVWHSVAVSADVSMPPDKVTEGVDVDLATIPFHFRFQRLLDLFGAANGDALATVISRFQTRALSSGRYEKLSPEQRKILRLGDVALSEIADARRAFNQIDSEKLARRTRALLGLGSISSSRGFEGDWASAGS